MGIVIIICITIIVICAMYFYIYYNLQINKDFKQKSKDITDIINTFVNNYIDDIYTNKPKFKGNGIDIKNLCKTIKEIL